VALKAFAIQGVQTNSALLMGIIQHQAFLEGNIDTKFLDKYKII
jgi:biotin carboxylase